MSEETGGADQGEYKPPPEFLENVKEPLLELSSTDSVELWLVQWPVNQPPDFDGQELSLKLHHDGRLGSFEGSSGKKYKVVSFASQEPDATVFLSSASESKIVGKISRRVSLVHNPEPDELEKLIRKDLKQKGTSSLTNSSHHFATPPSSIKMRNSQPASGRSASTYSSRHKSSLYEGGEASKPSVRRRAHQASGSVGQSTHDSGRSHSAVTSSGSLGHSRQGKSKKIKVEA